MARVHQDGDVDLAALDGRTVGVIGYGNQGRAQALNMRDSGLAVVVGNIDDAYAAEAARDGFTVHSIAEAARAADIVLMLIPDEVQPAVYGEQIAPHLDAGNVLCFASGYNIHYERIVPPASVDVILVAPRMIGQAVRNLYKQGAGFPCLVAAHQDASGRAMPTALALAKAIGATRFGAFESSFQEETLIDLFAEQMLWPGILKLCQLYFEKLVAAGCDPEVVTSELYLSGEFVEIARAMITEGFFGQLELHSHTSQYGQLSRADRMAPSDLLAAIDGAMAEIQGGAFAREWAAEQEAGLPALKRLRAEALAHPMNRSEEQLAPLRKLMAAWIRRSAGPADTA
jgi:ketol-acid reductoisomerase